LGASGTERSRATLTLMFAASPKTSPGGRSKQSRHSSRPHREHRPRHDQKGKSELTSASLGGYFAASADAAMKVAPSVMNAPTIIIARTRDRTRLSAFRSRARSSLPVADAFVCTHRHSRQRTWSVDSSCSSVITYLRCFSRPCPKQREQRSGAHTSVNTPLIRVKCSERTLDPSRGLLSIPGSARSSRDPRKQTVGRR
jgi:hypothetical protein